MFATRHAAAASPFGRVVLVASLGGMDAFITILGGLPAGFPVPVVVVQHRPHTSNGQDALVAVLSRRIPLPVKVAEAGGSSQEAGVTVVPGGVTLTIGPAGRWILTATTRDQWPGDAMLISSAAISPTVAVILTGYQSDGSIGCRAVKTQGGRVLVQDPSGARAPGMPSSAIATGCADFVLPLDRISTALRALVSAPGAADLLTVPPPPWALLTS
jgi:two-component system, chemotaxis family, protein-glutamate methylesterase/glutaminase